MRALFLIPHPEDAASGRLRVLQYLPWLRQHGIQCEARPFMSRALYRTLYQPGRLSQKLALSATALLKRLWDVLRSTRADVVLVHREALPLGTALLERLIAGAGRPLIFDFDDAIYLEHSSAANRWARMLKRADKISEIVTASSQVIVGNQVLGVYARLYNPRVTVIPTPVDTERFQCRSALRKAGRVVIGWMGSHTTAGYLRAVEHPLVTVARRYPEVEFRVVGASPVPLGVPRLRSTAWSLEREQDDLEDFDIGLMPMPDTAWARGKCGFKALLYMSVGLPVVASPVGVNRDIVQDGLSGFLATTEQEWIDRLSHLIEDRTLRERMGAAGRAIVEREYSLAVHAPRLLGVLQAAATGHLEVDGSAPEAPAAAEHEPQVLNEAIAR